MSVLLAIAALALATLAVYPMTSAVLERPGAAARLERSGVAIAFAIGASSALFFLWRLAGYLPASYPPAEVLIALACAAAAWAHWRAGRAASRDAAREPRITTIGEPDSVVGAALGLTVILLVFAALAGGRHAMAMPHGEWDAWAIWNLRASFMIVPSERWTDGFTRALEWSHPEYPLLVPASVARLWTYAGGQVPPAGHVLGAAVLIGTTTIVAGGVLRACGYAGLAMAVGLTLVPEYLFWGMSQHADVPLSLYIVAAVVLLSGDARSGRWMLAGAAAGFAAWTKNEGLVAALALALAGMVVTVASPAGTRRWRPLAAFALGALPPALVLVVFSLTLQPPSDFVEDLLGSDPLGKITDLGRHTTAAAYMLEQFLWWGGWAAVPPALVAAAWFVGGTIRAGRLPRAVYPGLMALLVPGSAYYVVYVVTPYDLAWHLHTSWPRLVAQLWPTFIWTCVVAGTMTMPERGGEGRVEATGAGG